MTKRRKLASRVPSHSICQSYVYLILQATTGDNILKGSKDCWISTKSLTLADSMKKYQSLFPTGLHLPLHYCITTLQLLPTNLRFSSLSYSLMVIPFPSQPLSNTQLLSMLPNYRVETRQFCACFQVMHMLNSLLIGRQVEEATHSSTFHKVVIFKKLTGPSHFKMHVPLLMITSGKNG